MSMVDWEVDGICGAMSLQKPERADLAGVGRVEATRLILES